MFTRITSFSRRVRRGVFAHRRLLAFLLTASAVAIGFSATRPDPPDTSTMAVASRDLPVGTVLTAADLTDVSTDPANVPVEVAALHTLAPVQRDVSVGAHISRIKGRPADSMRTAPSLGT